MLRVDKPASPNANLSTTNDRTTSTPSSTPRTRPVITALHTRADCVAALLGGVAHAGLGLEPIARPGDCLDETRRAPLVPELHPQLADVTIDDVALDLEFAPPDAGKEVFPAQCPSGVGGEEIEKSLLDRSELKVAAADGDALFDQVDLESIESDLWHDRDGEPMGSSQEREWAGDDLIQRERDLDDVVHAALVGAQFQRGVPPTREREDRHVAMGEPAPDDLDE